MSENLPVQWADRLATEAKEVAALERPSVAQISLKGGVMMYQGQKVPGNKLGCIVVSSVFQHRYYSKAYDPNNLANPDCFALSLSGEDMVPHEDSKEKQAANCNDCPHFKWGSDPKGGRGKACRASRRLAVIPAIPKDGDPVEFVKKAEIAILTLPVTSIRNWGNYVNQLANEYRRPPWSVFTSIEVEPDPKKQFSVGFQCTGIAADEGVLGALHGRRDAIDEILMTPYDASGDGEKEEADDSKKKY
jgi:hypothetical protein